MLKSKEQLINEQKDDVEFGCLYSYLEDPDGVQSANVAMFQECSQSFKLIDDFLFSFKNC